MGNTWSNQRFRLLLLIVGLTGLTQGLLLPLQATLLEHRGISASMNGLNAAALYLGILVITPFCGQLFRRWGYRDMMVIGLLFTTLCVWLLPVLTGFYAWTLLRFLIGVGNSLLHYASQLWVTTISPKERRGRHISQYGFAYGVGFGFGPLGLNLLHLGEAVPFITIGLLLSAALLPLIALKQNRPQVVSVTKHQLSSRLSTVYRWGLVALCPPLIYGFLEATLAGSFPVYGVREGLSTQWVSTLLMAFIYGGLLFQLPLGLLSDWIGRKRVLIGACFMGAVGLMVIPMSLSSPYLALLLFVLTGGVLGSLFSLGLAYLADLLPASYMPEGNIAASLHFGLGSMAGPYAGGIMIQYIGGESLFFFVSGLLAFFVFLAIAYRPEVSRKIIKRVS